MSTERIYVDASQRATLCYCERSISCFTLLEARIAWDKLPPAQQNTATILVAGGRSYRAAEIERLHYDPKLPDA
jgi:hypothetical protein